MLRVVEMCMELEATVEHQSKMIRIFTRVIKELSEEVTSGHPVSGSDQS